MPTAPAFTPATASTPLGPSASVPQSSLHPPGATAAKQSFKDTIKSFNEAAALRAARRGGDEVNPRTEVGWLFYMMLFVTDGVYVLQSSSAASDKKRKPSTSTNDGRSAESKRSRSASTQSKKVEEKVTEYRVVLVPRTRQVHEGRYQKPDTDTYVLNGIPLLCPDFD